MPELRTRVFKTSLAEMLEGPLRAVLEQNELKDYLAKRRWFSAKDQTITSARFGLVGPLPGTGGRVVMAEVEAGFNGVVERFSLPCAIVEEADAVTPLPSQLALGRFRHGRRVGFITDAFSCDAFAHGVVAALRAGATVPVNNGDVAGHGELRFVPTPRLERTVPSQDAESRRFSAEPSNSSLAIRDSLVVKRIRRLPPGTQPDAAMT